MGQWGRLSWLQLNPLGIGATMLCTDACASRPSNPGTRACKGALPRPCFPALHACRAAAAGGGGGGGNRAYLLLAIAATLRHRVARGARRCCAGARQCPGWYRRGPTGAGSIARAVCSTSLGLQLRSEQRGDAHCAFTTARASRWTAAWEPSLSAPALGEPSAVASKTCKHNPSDSRGGMAA